jgi:hypothetical protein
MTVATTTPAADAPVELTHDEWMAEGTKRFGADMMSWRFVCPRCGHVATPADWRAAGAPQSAAAFSCVGRWLPGEPRDAFKPGPGPCNYAGGGLFRLNPVHVLEDGKRHEVFAFAQERQP